MPQETISLLLIIGIVLLALLLLSSVAIMVAGFVIKARRKRAGQVVDCNLIQRDVYLHIVDGKVTVLNKSPDGLVSATVAEEVNENNVVFEARGERMTFQDKLAKLPRKQRAYLDRVLAHVSANPNVKRNDSSNKIQFKYRTDNMMSVVIKRGVLMCQFILPDSDVSRMVKQANTKRVKIAPVVIRLESEGSVQDAIRTADIAMEHYNSEHNYRVEQRKQARREKYRNSK